MAAELSVRRASEADIPEILQLVRLSLGEGKIPRDTGYWSWKHLASPFGPSPVLLAEAEGRLVGLRVFMRWGWQAGGERLEAVRAVDTATHPEWRGKGIFSRLTRALAEQLAAEGVAFVFNTPNDQSRPGYLKMGWSVVGRVPLRVRVLRPLRVARALLTRGASRSGSSPAAASAAAGGAGGPDELLAEPALEEFLAAQADGDSRLRTPRSVEYLRWRYRDIPGFAYRAAWQLRGDEGAIAIFRTETHGALLGLRLCELLVGPGRASQRMGRSVLRAALGDSGAAFAAAVAAARTPEQRLLLSSGFLPVPRIGPVFTVRPLGPLRDGLSPLDWSSWRLAIGDLELF